VRELAVQGTGLKLGLCERGPTADGTLAHGRELPRHVGEGGRAAVAQRRSRHVHDHGIDREVTSDAHELDDALLAHRFHRSVIRRIRHALVGVELGHKVVRRLFELRHASRRTAFGDRVDDSLTDARFERLLDCRVGSARLRGSGLERHLRAGGHAENITARINASLADAVASPEIRAKFRALGYEVMDPVSPEDFSLMIRQNIRKWEKVVKDTGLKME
jgi:hypothetical protein